MLNIKQTNTLSKLTYLQITGDANGCIVTKGTLGDSTFVTLWRSLARRWAVVRRLIWKTLVRHPKAASKLIESHDGCPERLDESDLLKIKFTIISIFIHFEHTFLFLKKQEKEENKLSWYTFEKDFYNKTYPPNDWIYEESDWTLGFLLWRWESCLGVSVDW